MAPQNGAKAAKRKQQKPRAKRKRTRESTAAQWNSSGIDRRHQNKGRVENLIPHQWKPGQSGNPSGRHTTSHDELRKLIQEIGNEPHPELPEFSRLELMLRTMMVAKDARDHQNILEHGFGKVPQNVRVETWKDEIIAALRAGHLPPDELRQELGDDAAATELLVAAGFPGDAGRETGEESTGESTPEPETNGIAPGPTPGV